MRSNFIKITNWYGRCQICSFQYSKDQPEEVLQHSIYHRRYILAYEDGFLIPVSREDREQMMREGAELLKRGTTLSERVAGAEQQLNALFYDHRAAVLRGTEPLRSFCELVTNLDISGKLDSRYGKDIADELRHRHLGSAAEVTGPSHCPC